MTEVARTFLTRCFAPGSTIALLLRTEHPAKTEQRVGTLEQALAPQFLRWLSRENHHGANVYVGANPLLPGSRRRTKENVDSIRHLYLDIDYDGDARLNTLRAFEGIPSPSAIISTSPAKYQVLWRVDGFNVAHQEATLKQLVAVFGGDSACTDCNRVLRIPGFLNKKYAPACRIKVEYGPNRLWYPSDFQLPTVSSLCVSRRSGNTQEGRSHNTSRSEHDWAWACQQLAQGKDPNKLTRELASRRSDKPNPLYYAQRTVDVATARQWLLEGAPFEDVITMLKDRRRFEFPATLCCARAWEIAVTAQRMITRRTTA